MSTHLNVLIVEDSESDAALIARRLGEANNAVSYERVETAAQMNAALAKGGWDVVISDYKLPHFSGPAALKLQQEIGKDIPFIVVSGAIGEEAAVAMMRSGAHDYLMKDNLARLALTVRREIQSANARRERHRAETNIKDMLEWQKAIFEGSRDAIFISDEQSRFVSVNTAACELTGYSREELLKMRIPDLHEQLDPIAYEPFHKRILQGEKLLTEAKISRKDGNKINTEFNNTRIVISGTAYMHTAARDVSERKRAEEALRESELLYRSLINVLPDGVALSDPSGTITFASPQLKSIYGAGSPEEALGTNALQWIAPESREKALKAIQSLLKKESWADHDYVLMRKDGSRFCGEIDGALLTDTEGNPKGLVTVHRDISDRKRVEQLMKQQVVAMEAASDGMAILDSEGKFIFLNDAHAQVYGYALAEELIDKTWEVLYDEDELKRFHETIMPKFWAAGQWHGEAIGCRADKTKFAQEVSLNKLEGGGLVCVVRDITDRKLAEDMSKQAERALRESEERFRLLVENAPDAIFVQTNYRFAYVNKEALKLFGAESAEQLLSHPVLDRFHPDYHGQVRQRIKNLNEKKNSVPALEEVYLKLDGSPVHVEVSAVPMNFLGDAGALIFVRDITERKLTAEESKQAEDALRQSEARYRSVLQSANDAIVTADKDGKITGWNTGAERMFGFSYVEAVGEPLTCLMPQRYRAEHTKGLKMLQSGGNSGVVGKNIERRGMRKDGSEFPMELSLSTWEAADSQFYTGIIRDITDRKRADAALRESEEKFRALFEESKDMVYFSTVEGRFLEINPAGIELLGYSSKDEILQIDLKHEGYADSEDKMRFDQQMENQGFVKDWEVVLRRQDGRKLTVLETATAVRDENGRTVQYRGFMRDVTKQRLLERQFLQAQKMESIGTLAGGIAHDFNNILGIVLGHLALLERTRENEVQFEESIFSINQAVERGASLVRQILTFARKSETELEPVNINAAITELGKMLEETLPKTIEVALQLDKTIPVVSMDPTQLHQTMLNLCVNARDAMNGRGCLTISTRLVPKHDVLARFPKASANHYAQVSVADKGTGMDEETKQKIFEPFFTTKEKGKGTGLGLAVVYGVLQAHSGFVDVETAMNVGTTFHLFFPIPEGILSISEKEPGRQEDLSRGTETILLVEDEDVLRDLLTKLLEMQGYTVIPACDGDEAVKHFGEHADEIELVLSDIGLPKRSGWDAFKEMQKLDPNVCALLASGYLEPGQKSEILKSGVMRFIHKPYRMDEVLKAVREALDEKSK